MLLSQCNEGDEVVVRKVAIPRLLVMGVVPGKVLNIVKYAPFKDPIEVAISHNRLALRVSEAKLIEVELVAKDLKDE